VSWLFCGPIQNEADILYFAARLLHTVLHHYLAYSVALGIHGVARRHGGSFTCQSALQDLGAAGGLNVLHWLLHAQHELPLFYNLVAGFCYYQWLQFDSKWLSLLIGRILAYKL
jgi:hypothetical protein